jgi:O-antigen/teichoic acid export membrane protein
MFSYSINLQLSSLLFFWIEPLNKIIISNYFSVAYVGYYDIALKFNSRITSLVRSGLSSMFPAAAEKFEKTGGTGIENLRRTSLKYLFPLLTVIYIVGIFITPPFIDLWLGPQYHVVTIAICIFLMGSYFSILATPSYVLLLGSGFSGDTLRIQWQSMLVNVVVIVVFTWLSGFYGFCAGYSCSMLYGFFITHIIYQKRFDVIPGAFRVFINPRLLISALAIMATGVAFLTFVQVVSWILLVGMIAVMVLIAFLSIWKLQIITGKDIGNLFGVVDLKSILPQYRKNL